MGEHPNASTGMNKTFPKSETCEDDTTKLDIDIKKSSNVNNNDPLNMEYQHLEESGDKILSLSNT